MNNFTFNDSGGNQVRITSRWYGLLSFCMLFLALLFLPIQMKGQEYTPLLVSSGFTDDVIAETSPASDSTTNSVDAFGTGAFGNGDHAFVVNGYPGAGATSGFPTNGLLTSVTTPGLQFQMGAYDEDNSLRLESAVSGVGESGTLVFTNQVAALNIYVLATGGSGACTFTGTITFTDNTTQAITSQTVADWYNGTPVVYYLNGRIHRGTNQWETATNNPRVYQVAIAIDVANQTKQIESISFLNTQPNVGRFLNIFGVSAEIVPDCPMPVSLAASVTGTDVELSWSSLGDSFEVEWGASGFTLGNGTSATGLISNSHSLNGLATGAYDFYVRQDCGANGFSNWAGPFSFGIGFYGGGDIPTLYGTPATSADAACTPSAVMTINVPAGYMISNINVQYDMTAWGGAWMSEQRSALWSPTINTGEAAIAAGAGGTAGTFSYDRNTSFANGATGSVDFVLKAWRTWGGSDCGTTYNYVNNNTWIITPTFELLPDCLTPIGLSVDNITAGSADLSWISPGTLFDIKWGDSGFNVETEGTLVPEVSNPYTLPGLNQTTIYDYYVRMNCSSTNDGVSTWAGPFTFTTECDTFILPFQEQFSSGVLPNCWANTSSNPVANGLWKFTGNPDYGAAPAINGKTSGTFAWVDGSDPTNMNDVTLTSPPIDVSSLTVPCISFEYFSNNLEVANYPNNVFTVQVNDGTGWTTVFTDNTNDMVWRDIEVPLTTFTGTTLQVRFVVDKTIAPVGYAFYNDILLDNVRVIEAPTCPKPLALTATNATAESAVLGWTSDGTLFDIIYGVSGFDVNTEGILITGVTDNPYTLTGLDQSTNYQYYVRQDCDLDGVSDWAGPFGFITTQIPVDLDYEEDFEGTHNWILSNGTQANKWVVGEATANGGTKSLYISNDDGVTNNYNVNSTSVVHAYRDVQIPTDAESILLSFDWKALAEACCDYIRVWVVPSTFAPVPGTQITVANSGGGVQFGANFNNQANWTNQWYEIPSLAYAGQIVRLVFEWRNDGSLGNAPSGAIDNVEVSVITCAAPTELAVAGITTNSAVLSWTSVGASFDIEYGTTGFTPTGTPSLTNVSNNYTLGSLSSATTYQYYVRQDCGTDGVSAWTGPFTFTTECDTFILPFQEQFSSGVLPNCWANTSSNPVANGLWKFTGNPDYGAAPAINGKVSGTFAWVDGSDPTNMNDVTLTSPPIDVSSLTVPCISFEYFSNNLEVANYSNNVFTVQVNDGTGWTTVFTDNTNDTVWRDIEVPLTTFTGTILQVRFVVDKTIAPVGYAFYNDILLDNVRVIEAPTCPKPLALTATNATAESAVLGWTSDGTLFDIKYGESGFNVYTEGILITGVTDNPYTLTGLDQSTNYQYYVRQDCDLDGVSDWAGPFGFITTQIPVDLDYEEDFEGTHNWILSNGTQANKWVVGEFTANGGTKSLYISNDDGVTNNYNVNSTSVVHAYRDVQIPTDAESVLLSFDWKSGGESIYDYFRVWVVPSTFAPVPGTQIAANSGGIQLGANYNLQANWTNQWFEVPSLAYAGQIVRLVIEWRNDGSAGTMPGAAIDNVEISVITCPAPSGLAAGNLTLNSADLSWTSNGTSFNVQYGNAGFTLGSGTILTNVTSPYTLEDLTAHTSYEYYVQQDCGVDGVSTWSGPYFFHTGHCIPSSTNSGDHISSFVTTGGIPYNITNTGSGASPGGYGNFGNMSVSHYETGTIDFTLTAGGDPMSVNIWVDWNNNLEFEESEKVFASGGPNPTITGSFSVPFGTPVGDYRMRVRGQWNNANPAPCGVIAWGEAEDYTLTVIDPPSCLPPFNPMATNISASSVSLSWQSTGDVFDIEWGEQGFVQGTGTLIEGIGNPYVLGGLTGGVAYDFYVRRDCTIDDDGYSMWNGPVTFTPGVFEGDIPTLLNANPQVDDIACATSFAIDVPAGQFLSGLTVSYMMTSSSPAWDSHQRSVLYSSTLGMGEPQVVSAPNPQNYPGVVYYERSVDFAYGATGTVEFELKAWRTEGGTGCGTDRVFVENGTWVLNATFEDIPSCPNPPADLGYTNITADSVDLIWTSEETGTFQVNWGAIGFNPETTGTTISDIETFSYTLSGLDSSIPYEYYVRRDCSTDDEEDFGDWVGPVRFNSGHCLPYATQGFYFTLFNTTNAVENVTYTYPDTALGTGYVNTDMIITEDAGETFNFTSNYVGGASGLRIWVDWNNDFVFEDDEQVYYVASGSGNKSGEITIPVGTPGGDYRMRVRAQQGGTSTPPACGLIGTGEALDFTLRVSCEEVATPTGDTVQYFTEGQTLADLDVTGDNLVWYADEDLTIVLDPTTELVHDTTYYVVSTNGGCQSEALAVTVELTSSVSDFNSFGFRYYPNPVSEQLYLSANAPISDVKVINMLGQQVNAPANSDNTNVDMSGLPTGNYLIKVTIEGVSKTLKVVKK